MEKTLAPASIVCISFVYFGLLPPTFNFFKTVYTIGKILVNKFPTFDALLKRCITQFFLNTSMYVLAILEECFKGQLVPEPFPSSKMPWVRAYFPLPVARELIGICRLAACFLVVFARGQSKNTKFEIFSRVACTKRSRYRSNPAFISR